MVYSERFWDGVNSAGVAGAGLYGAYNLAMTWGGVNSLWGIVAGSCGVLLGGIGGALVGALILPLVIGVVACALELITNLGSSLFSGLHQSISSCFESGPSANLATP